MARMMTKLCPVCGKEFKGTEGKITCSNACRTATSRMLAKGKKPEFWLIAKSKGQKMPLVFNGPIPKKTTPVFDKKNDVVKFVSPTPESFDGGRISPYIQDEQILMEMSKELTWEEKMAFNAEIDRLIGEEKSKKHQTGMHPRQFKLQQEEKIAELEKQKIN